MMREERIARLESLLTRVQGRAKEPRGAKPRPASTYPTADNMVVKTVAVSVPLVRVVDGEAPKAGTTSAAVASPVAQVPATPTAASSAVPVAVPVAVASAVSAESVVPVVSNPSVSKQVAAQFKPDHGGVSSLRGRGTVAQHDDASEADVPSDESLEEVSVEALVPSSRRAEEQEWDLPKRGDGKRASVPVGPGFPTVSRATPRSTASPIGVDRAKASDSVLPRRSVQVVRDDRREPDDPTGPASLETTMIYRPLEPREDTSPPTVSPARLRRSSAPPSKAFGSQRTELVAAAPIGDVNRDSVRSAKPAERWGVDDPASRSKPSDVNLGNEVFEAPVLAVAGVASFVGAVAAQPLRLFLRVLDESLALGGDG